MIVINSLLDKAKYFEDQGKFIHALQFYKKVLESEPKNKFAITKLLSIYEKLNNYKAILNFIFSENLVEEEDDLLLLYSQIAFKHKDYETVIKILQNVSDKEYSSKTFLMGLAYFRTGKFEIAKIKFEEFIKKEKGSEILSEAYLYAAKTNLELGNYEDAYEQLKFSEKLSSFNWELYLTFADYYFRKEMYLHAIEAIKKGLELEGNNEVLKLFKKKIELEMNKGKVVNKN